MELKTRWRGEGSAPVSYLNVKEVRRVAREAKSEIVEIDYEPASEMPASIPPPVPAPQTAIHANVANEA